MHIGRRRFIGLVGGAAAGAAIGTPIGRLFSNVLATADQPLDPPRGPEGFVLSACAACPGGCGLRARRIGDRVVNVMGNPRHPVSGGRLCAKGQAAIQALYHPDRILHPMRRVGPRGSLASFKQDTWEHALAEIETRLRSLRDQRRPEAFVMLHSGAGADARLARRLLEAFGSPNAIPLGGGNDADALALFYTQGIHATPAYDLRSADYILSLGSEFLEAAPSPVFTTRAYGDFRQSRSARRGKLIHVDPRMSLTATSADEWIAIRPGTHGVFALGVAAAMVSEGLYNREFVGELCSGFEDQLRPLLEQQFTLESVAAQTGVNVNTILRVAREFAASRGVALGPRKGPLLPGRLFDHLSAHVLNALVGNIDQPGGLLVPETAPLESPEIARDAVASAGLRQPRLDGRAATAPADTEQLADALRAGSPYRADVLFVLDADPLFTTTGDRFRQAFDRLPFVVSFTSVPSDTALYSDWILPQAHFLERADLHTSAAGVPFASATLAQRASAPAKEVRASGDVLIDIAHRLGFKQSFPWTDLDAFLRTEMDSLYAARRGAIMGTHFDEAWVRMMEGAGWWAPGYASADELWQRAQESGGWWDPFYDHGDWSRVLRTESGRFEFRADLLKQMAETNDDANAQGSLALLLFEPLPIAGGSGAELPFLQGLLDAAQPYGWHTWGEIHPDTARELGIHNGARLRVSSSQASIDVTVRVTDRVVPGAMAIPVGLGREGGGRWAAGSGANPLRLVGGLREPVSLLLNRDSARVIPGVANATKRI
ncbi:MAG TPA: molybdopterin-dependent oxidoreductase [Thermoanaerobaculia bacterium]|nr:molybdopterin-dependent oxidoreductase [Thermoanaerobaculia bacterium]